MSVGLTKLLRWNYDQRQRFGSSFEHCHRWLVIERQCARSGDGLEKKNSYGQQLPIQNQE